MIGGQDLHARADLSLVTDGDRDDVQDHAVEVEEDMRAEADVEAVVAVERRADDASLADGGEALEEELTPFRGGQGERRVVSDHSSLGGRQVVLVLGVRRCVEFSHEHLRLLAAPARLCHCWAPCRSEEHKSEIQSLMRISYAV